MLLRFHILSCVPSLSLSLHCYLGPTTSSSSSSPRVSEHIPTCCCYCLLFLFILSSHSYRMAWKQVVKRLFLFWTLCDVKFSVASTYTFAISNSLYMQSTIPMHITKERDGQNSGICSHTLTHTNSFSMLNAFAIIHHSWGAIIWCVKHMFAIAFNVHRNSFKRLETMYVTHDYVAF